jgi:hypothetical protein
VEGSHGVGTSSGCAGSVREPWSGACGAVVRGCGVGNDTRPPSPG